MSDNKVTVNRSRIFDIDIDVPMDLAVAHWRMITDEDFRYHWQSFGDECERWRMQSARNLLIACDSMEYEEIYEFVKKNPPTGDVIAKLVILAKEAQKSKSAQKAAIKRHRENHAMKAEVFQWLDSQPKFKSIGKAATEITKQQPIAHVTATDWFKEWRKQRSASTP